METIPSVEVKTGEYGTYRVRRRSKATGCSLCSIPAWEPLIAENDLAYLVDTKEKKGHTVRVMVVMKRHSARPSFEERTAAYAALISYMQHKMGNEKWFIVGMSRYTSIRNHWHLMACDNKSIDPEEQQKLHDTPRVMFPMSMRASRILIGIPAYNEERTIGQVVWKARKYGNVMVVDDGSTDATAELALSAGACVKENDENYGYGYSLAKIFREAKEVNPHEILVTLDADDQHDPEEIPNFIGAIEEGADVAVGNRFMAKVETGIPKYRRFGIDVFSKLVGTQDSQCGFRAYSRRAIESINVTEKGMGASFEILQQARDKGLKIVEVPCTVRYEKKAKRSPIRHGMELIETLLWSTVWKNPVVYLGLPSLVLSALGLLSAIVLIDEYLRARWFALQWAVIGLGGIIGGLVLGLSAITIWSIKRGLRSDVS